MSERNFVWHGYRFEWKSEEQLHGSSSIDAGYEVTHGNRGNWNDGDRGDERFLGRFDGPPASAKAQLLKRLRRDLDSDQADLKRREGIFSTMKSEV